MTHLIAWFIFFGSPVPCTGIHDSCLDCIDGALTARAAWRVKVTTSEGDRVVTQLTTTLNRGDVLRLEANQGYACLTLLELPKLTQPEVDADNPPIEAIGYARGHKSVFCRAKGYSDVAHDRCTGRPSGCRTMPLELIPAYKPGAGQHKSKLCRKAGFDGYEPGGRPGYCFAGAGCEARYRVGVEACRFAVQDDGIFKHACTSLDRPDIRSDLNYRRGHKAWFCRGKGYQTVEADKCVGRVADCYTLPLDLLGYEGGHKVRFCEKRDFDGYQPGGRPGYCYRGPGCAQRTRIGENEKKFETR